MLKCCLATNSADFRTLPAWILPKLSKTWTINNSPQRLRHAACTLYHTNREKRFVRPLSFAGWVLCLTIVIRGIGFCVAQMEHVCPGSDVLISEPLEIVEKRLDDIAATLRYGTVSPERWLWLAYYSGFPLGSPTDTATSEQVRTRAPLLSESMSH